MDVLRGAKDRADGRKSYFADPAKVILYLLLLVFQLKRIRQHLPAAAATNAKMRAKRFHPVRGIGTESGDLAFRPVLLIPGKPDIDNIPGYRVFNEDHFPVYAGQGFAFCGIVLNEYARQSEVLIFFSHGGKGLILRAYEQ